MTFFFLLFVCAFLPFLFGIPVVLGSPHSSLRSSPRLVSLHHGQRHSPIPRSSRFGFVPLQLSCSLGVDGGAGFGVGGWRFSLEWEMVWFLRKRGWFGIFEDGVLVLHVPCSSCGLCWGDPFQMKLEAVDTFLRMIHWCPWRPLKPCWHDVFGFSKKEEVRSKSHDLKSRRPQSS